MYKKEIERKFLVDKNKVPVLSDFDNVKIKQGYLSQGSDSLTVRVRSINDEEFVLELKDSGTLERNEVTYNITKEEFEVSYKLCGNKTIEKTRYYVPSEKNDGKIIEVDVYKDFDFVTAEYEGESKVDVESFISEDWFMEDVTYTGEYSNQNLANNKHLYK